MDMFRKICSFVALSLIVFSAFALASADAKINYIGQSGLIAVPAEDCPKCRLQQQRENLKELIQPIKDAVQSSPVIEAIRYDAKLDGQCIEECKPCQSEQKVRAAGPRSVKLRNGRVHLRLGGRRCCHSC